MQWLGINIKEISRQNSLSISQLAKEMQVSRKTVYDWVNGQTPKGNNLLKLCKVLKIHPDIFFSYEKDTQITVPVHRQRMASKITIITQNEAYKLSETYLNLFRNSTTPEIVTVIRDNIRNLKNAKAIANKLRERVEIPPEKPMDTQYAFKLIDELGINIIFKDFPKTIKSYAFYTKIVNHRVIFLNNSTKLIDLIFPLLHESVHAIRDEAYVAETYDDQEEEFCDLVANFLQFPQSYVNLVYETIRDLDKGVQINKLKNFARQNIHSLFGIIKAIKIAYPDFALSVGAADSNLRKEFSTIGQIIYNPSDLLKFIETLKTFSKNFYSIVSNQVQFLSDRRLAQILNLESVFDASQIKTELLKATD